MRSVCTLPPTAAGELFRTSQYPNLPTLAKTLHRSEFYHLGSAAHPAHPTTAEGKPAAHLGTGAYALDLLCTNPGPRGRLVGEGRHPARSANSEAQVREEVTRVHDLDVLFPSPLRQTIIPCHEDALLVLGGDADQGVTGMPFRARPQFLKRRCPTAQAGLVKARNVKDESTARDETAKAESAREVADAASPDHRSRPAHRR